MPTELVGDVVRTADDDYDASRAVFNAMIDRRPLAVLRCHDTADVVHGIAVRLNQNVVPAGVGPRRSE